MKKLTSIAATLGLALAAAPTALGQDVASVEELPEAVRQTVQRETEGATVGDIERDDERGRVVYEIEFVKDDRKYELDVAEDGRVLRRHQD